MIWGRNPEVVRYSVAYDPEQFRFVANDMVLSSGAQLLFHLWGARAIMEGDRIAAVAVESKSGREAISAKMVIDTTGDGDLFASAGEAAGTAAAMASSAGERPADLDVARLQERLSDQGASLGPLKSPCHP